MKSLVDIFNKINSTNSTIEKETILKLNFSNQQLKELLEANLNPYKLYQFNKIPCEPNYVDESNWSELDKHNAFMALLEDLSSRSTTGTKAKENITSVMRFFEKGEHFDLYAKILTKESIGVGAKTVNKVWPNLIPEFKIMLAPNELPNIAEVNYPINLQPKLDGFRCIYYKGQLWSRTGKPFGNNNLSSYFSILNAAEDYVLDGELYVESLSFNKLQTILNTYEHPVPNTLKFIVYDCMPKVDWETQKCLKPYHERLKLLRTVLNDKVANYKKVIDIPNDLVQNAAEAVDLYKKYLKQGYEGVMLKASEGLYKWKRVTVNSGEMLKLKPFKTIDLQVTNIYDGEGKFQGVAGGVVVDYNGTAVRVGSGFNDTMRKDLASKPNEFIGKMVEIKYFEETKDKSLRFPIFVRWREEKD